MREKGSASLSGMQHAVNGRPRAFEFYVQRLGPVVVMLGAPAMCYALYFGCHAGGCLALRPRLQLPPLPKDLQLFSWEAVGVYLGYLLFQVRPLPACLI